MTKGALGWWAVRFLAAAGVSSVACSGQVETNRGAAGGSGAMAASGKSGNAGEDASGGGAESVASGGTGAMSAGVGAVGVSGSPDVAGGPMSAGGAEPDPPVPENPFPCLNAKPFGNADSGLEQCDNGMLRRAWVGSCDPATTPEGGCLVDADCPPTAAGGGTICICDQIGTGTCAAADCSTDGDCVDGFSCVTSRAQGCELSPLLFACQTPSDQCGVRADCTDGFYECAWQGGSAGGSVSAYPMRTCGTCSGPGRPFLIESAPRTARTEARSDWCEPSLQCAAGELSGALRAQLTAHWQQQAEMEHASVAAFARFILELLSLGAPPDLVSAATSALADETAHARLCYALASAYAGHPLGPTKLDVTGALGELEPCDIVTRAVLEGCVGETLAALEAFEAASHVRDQALRQVLLRIAEDEARHAELSWRFVGWALSQGGSKLRAAVRKAFDCAKGELAQSVQQSTATDIELLDHGVLSPERRTRLALEVFATVIGPCADALLVEHRLEAGSEVLQSSA